MNKKEFLKARAEFNRFKRHTNRLLDELRDEKKYYGNEIKQYDYNDDDIWAIVLGTLNNTEIAILTLDLEYLCKFNRHKGHSGKWFIYGSSHYYYNDSIWDFQRIIIEDMESDLEIRYKYDYGHLDYGDYKMYPWRECYKDFTKWYDALNEFKQSHQVELLNQEPVDTYVYDDGVGNKPTPVYISDDEPDEPDEPDDIE